MAAADKAMRRVVREFRMRLAGVLPQE